MSLRDNEPIFYVVVVPSGGTEERIDATTMVLSFEYEEDEKKTDQLKLTIDNWDLSHFDNPVWRQGNKVIVTWGYPGKMAPLRECIIQKVEGSTQITVTAQAKSLLMNRDVKNKTYENTRRSEIVHAIAKDYGFGDDQRFIEETETLYEGITQAQQTDAQFLKRLADAEHFEFYVDFSGLHWHPRKMGQKPLRVMQYYLPPDVGDIITFNVDSDPFAKPTQVTTKGRDPIKKADVSGTGNEQETKRIALVSPDTGVVGVKEVTEQKAVQPTTETSSSQAKKEADGAFKRSAQAAVKLSMECVGDPLVIAKSVLDVRGISKRLSGLYYINTASHKIDSGGYKMSLKVTTDSTSGHTEDLLKTPGAAKKPSKATPNPAKPGESKDPNEATPHVTVDPTTGGTATRYSPNPVAPQEKK